MRLPAKERLGAIWQEIAADAGVRVALLRGAGEKAFCAGSDIKEIHRSGRMVETDTLLRAIPGVGIALDKPVIAALHGYCMGMGMTLALHCDLRIAGTDAVLGYPEVRHGMISAVSALHLPHVLAPARALEMLLMARNIDAQEAMRWGLLNAVVEDPKAEAEEWASAIAGYAPAAVQATKRLALLSPPQRCRALRRRGGARARRGRGRLQARCCSLCLPRISKARGHSACRACGR